MKSSIKKLNVALVLVMFSVLLLLQVSTACSAEFSAPEKALTFLTDIIGLDMTKYDATLTNNHVEYPSDLNGLAKEYVDYTIGSIESNLDVAIRFRNGSLVYCKIYAYNNSLRFVNPSTSVLDATKDILQKYQTYAGGSYIQTMRDMLDTVTDVKNMTKSVGNIKLKISTGTDTCIDWMYTSNGIDFEKKRIHFSFRDGTFRSFRDDWSLYKIGSDSVIVSEEDAISIAMDATKNMPKLHGSVDNETVVLQPRVVEEPVEAELMVGIKEPLTLYPLWHVQLYFDKLYGNYYGVAVDVWANTKEISGTPYGTGIMGSFHGENSKGAQVAHLLSL